MHPALYLFPEFRDPRFDLVDPTGGGRGEVDGPVRMLRPPDPDFRRLVSGRRPAAMRREQNLQTAAGHGCVHARVCRKIVRPWLARRLSDQV